MATGIYVECNSRAALGESYTEVVYTGQPAWIEHIPSNGTSSNAVPQPIMAPFRPVPTYILRISAWTAGFLRVGPEVYSPGIGSGIWLSAGQTLEWLGNPGDRVSWAAEV